LAQTLKENQDAVQNYLSSKTSHSSKPRWGKGRAGSQACFEEFTLLCSARWMHLGRMHWKARSNFAEFETFEVQEFKNMTLFQYYQSDIFQFLHFTWQLYPGFSPGNSKLSWHDEHSCPLEMWRRHVEKPFTLLGRPRRKTFPTLHLWIWSRAWSASASFTPAHSWLCSWNPVHYPLMDPSIPLRVTCSCIWRLKTAMQHIIRDNVFG
jgi:hypothetical protein